MPFDAILISDVSIDEFLEVDDALVMCDLNDRDCKICFDYADKIPVIKYRASLGGNSANVAAGMAGLGIKVSVYSEIGKDANGDRFVKELKERGVDNSLLRQSLQATDIHSIVIYKGERTIFSYHGPKKYHVQSWEDPKWIYYSSLPKQFEPFQQELIDYLTSHPAVLTAFNPGVYHFKAGYKAYAPFLKITDLLFVNKEEALRILEQAGEKTDKISTRELHKRVQKHGPKMTAITDAGRGASVMSGREFFESASIEMKKPIVDKTGAGDAFSSGFLSALIYGKSLNDALLWGLKNSSACIREIGPMNGLLTRREIE